MDEDKDKGPLRIEPRFSEAINGASIGNCYIESGFSGKGATRLRGRMDIAALKLKYGDTPFQGDLTVPKGWEPWDTVIAAHQSSKTRNIYILSETNYNINLWVVRDGNLELAKEFGADYDMATRCGFSEMRFLGNSYVNGFAAGNYAILLAVKNGLWVLDDLDPLNAGKIREIKVPDRVDESDGENRIKVGSMCAVANRIIVSEADSPTWYFSSIGGVQDAEIEMFSALDFYDAEYSNDNIARVARVGGVRLAVFGERTLEIWDITGNPEDPFTTSHAGQVYKIGGIPGSVQEIGDTAYFCGIEDLSGRYAIYSIGREGLRKLSENPLDAMLTKTIKGMGKPCTSGKYAENAANFYLLHLEDKFTDSFTLAFNVPENAFSRFYHKTDSALSGIFNCILSTEKYAVGVHGGIFKQADGEPEYAGRCTEKLLELPIYDSGGTGRFLLRKLTIDMQTIALPRGALPELVIIDYSPDGTDTFIGRRSITVPEAGMGKLYPLRLWGLGMCNNLRLRMFTGTRNFIINAITIETEDCL